MLKGGKTIVLVKHKVSVGKPTEKESRTKSNIVCFKCWKVEFVVENLV